MLDFLERRLGRFAISNLTLYLIIGQVFVTLTGMLNLIDVSRLVLVPYLGLNGEPWRFVTFLFIPPPVGSTLGLMLLPFAWWVLYLMGSALENQWGVFRFNCFLLTGWALAVAASLVAPGSVVTNYFFYGSVFLAFAWFNQDFELMLFFILPVKMKWLGLLSLGMMLYRFVIGGLATRLQIGASAVTLLLFLGRELMGSARYRQRTMAASARRAAEERKAPEPRHRCYICGKTDLTNPEMDFRYCSKCSGDQCYCPEHIFNHEHVVENGETKA